MSLLELEPIADPIRLIRLQFSLSSGCCTSLLLIVNLNPQTDSLSDQYPSACVRSLIARVQPVEYLLLQPAAE